MIHGKALKDNSVSVAKMEVSGATAGTYGDSTHVAQVTVDARGRITSATNVAIAGGGGGSAFDNVIIVNGNSYSTAQTAYAAAVAVAAPVAMLVGFGSAFGDIVLTAPWDTNVSIVGFGRDVSQIGIINGSVAGGNGYDIEITVSRVTLGGVTASSTSVGNAGQIILTVEGCWIAYLDATSVDGAGGNLEVSSTNSREPVLAIIDNIDTSTTAGTSGGEVDLSCYNLRVGDIDTRGFNANGGPIYFGSGNPAELLNIVAGDLDTSSVNAAGGEIQVGQMCLFQSINTSGPTGSGEVVFGSNCRMTGPLNTSSSGGSAGNITAGSNFEMRNGTLPLGTRRNINASAPSGVAGNVNIQKGIVGDIDVSGATGGSITLFQSEAGTLTFGTVPGRLLAFHSKITGQIDKLHETSATVGCQFSTGGGLDCVADLNGDGAQFIDDLFAPNGSGVAISSVVPHTIVSFDSKGNGGLGTNVTISEGTFTEITANLVVP